MGTRKKAKKTKEIIYIFPKDAITIRRWKEWVVVTQKYNYKDKAKLTKKDVQKLSKKLGREAWKKL